MNSWGDLKWYCSSSAAMSNCMPANCRQLRPKSLPKRALVERITRYFVHQGDAVLGDADDGLDAALGDAQVGDFAEADEPGGLDEGAAEMVVPLLPVGHGDFLLPLAFPPLRLQVIFDVPEDGPARLGMDAHFLDGPADGLGVDGAQDLQGIAVDLEDPVLPVDMDDAGLPVEEILLLDGLAELGLGRLQLVLEMPHLPLERGDFHIVLVLQEMLQLDVLLRNLYSSGLNSPRFGRKSNEPSSGCSGVPNFRSKSGFSTP